MNFIPVILQLVSLIRRRVPKWIRNSALEAVASAANLTHLIDHNDRREWAVQQLMKRGVKENAARLAVELAVAAMKEKKGA